VVWAERSGSTVVRGAEARIRPPVVFDGMRAAKARGFDVAIVDTAGRLQTKINLMEELKKMRRVSSANSASRRRETLLVLDGTSGQNAISQAKLFNMATQLTGIVVTKLDSTARGVLVAIVDELEVPSSSSGWVRARTTYEPFHLRVHRRTLRRGGKPLQHRERFEQNAIPLALRDESVMIRKAPNA